MLEAAYRYFLIPNNVYKFLLSSSVGVIGVSEFNHIKTLLKVPIKHPSFIRYVTFSVSFSRSERENIFI